VHGCVKQLQPIIKLLKSTNEETNKYLKSEWPIYCGGRGW